MDLIDPDMSHPAASRKNALSRFAATGYAAVLANQANKASLEYYTKVNPDSAVMRTGSGAHVGSPTMALNVSKKKRPKTAICAIM